MKYDSEELLPIGTPLIYSDGTEFYKALGKKYIQHKKGLYIWAPSGAGKTHFTKNQKEHHWLDGDILWQSSNAHPKGEWWKEPLEYCDEVDSQSDIITMHAKKLGFWVVGASCFWLPPDALVIPDWDTHVSWIKKREETNYDGGAKSDEQALKQVKGHIEWASKKFSDSPKFSNMQEAVDYLVGKLN